MCVTMINLHAQNPNLGSAGAQFLKIPIGARSVALGGAVTGMSEDATALFWNPAGIAQAHAHSLHFSYIPWMTFFDITAIAYSVDLEEKGILGFHAITLGMDKLEITTERQPDGTGQYFDAQDMVVGASYAQRLTDRFSMGVSAKYIFQRIWNEKAHGLGFDVGTHYEIDFQKMVLAMSMQNFGPDMRLNGPELLVVVDDDELFPNRLLQTQKQTESYPLPLSFQFGLAANLIKNPYLHSRIAVDAIHYNDNAEQIHVGLETAIINLIILRGGYKFNNDEVRGSLGVGLKKKIDKMVLKLDTAVVMHERLGETTYMSMGILF